MDNSTNPAPGKPERPDWLETPDETGYDLVMSSDAGVEDVQRVSLTRAEYIALKQHLAELRGILPAKPVSEMMPGKITQQDLRVAVDAYKLSERIGAMLRKRFDAGADIERGPIQADIAEPMNIIGTDLGGLRLDWGEPEAEPAE